MWFKTLETFLDVILDLYIYIVYLKQIALIPPKKYPPDLLLTFCGLFSQQTNPGISPEDFTNPGRWWALWRPMRPFQRTRLRNVRGRMESSCGRWWLMKWISIWIYWIHRRYFFQTLLFELYIYLVSLFDGFEQEKDGGNFLLVFMWFRHFVKETPFLKGI